MCNLLQVFKQNKSVHLKYIVAINDNKGSSTPVKSGKEVR